MVPLLISLERTPTSIKGCIRNRVRRRGPKCFRWSQTLQSLPPILALFSCDSRGNWDRTTADRVLWDTLLEMAVDAKGKGWGEFLLAGVRSREGRDPAQTPQPVNAVPGRLHAGPEGRPTPHPAMARAFSKSQPPLPLFRSELAAEGKLGLQTGVEELRL